MGPVGLVLLAAGGSRRMGAPKQLLDVGGEPMLRRAAATALASACRPVVVVCGGSADTVAATIGDLAVEVIRNPHWQDGIGTSIRAGMRVMADRDVDAVVIALADQPLVTAASLDRLALAWQRSGRPIAASAYDGTLGVPALFDRSLFGDLLSLAADEGCKRLILSRLASQAEAVPLVATCACPEASLDVDTTEDYARLHRTLEQGVPRGSGSRRVRRKRTSEVSPSAG